MVTQSWFPLAAVVWFATAPCHADRVYRLVDYPANQDGHFLQGTITTTDAAPNDSLLDVSEILGWQWSITGANTFAASSLDYPLDQSITINVQVSSTAISLPYRTSSPTDLGILRLGKRLELGASGANEHQIEWSTGGRNPSSSARRQHGDAFQRYWGDFVTLPSGSNWIIAVAIPEPATAFLLTTCAAACALHRPPSRRK